MPYLYLVRHGQPDFAGNYDSITDLGARQSGVARPALRRPWPAFARVVSGTLQRQVSTLRTHPGRAATARDSGRRTRVSTSTTTWRCCASSKASVCRHAHRGRPPRATSRDPQRHAALVAARGAASGALESWSDFGARIEAGMAAACAGLPRDDPGADGEFGRGDRPLRRRRCSARMPTPRSSSTCRSATPA